MEAVLLYEGKAKKVFETANTDEVIISFKDDATAFNGVKKDSFSEKGRVNLAFTKYFFNLLDAEGIKTHIVSFIDETSLIAKKVEIIPLAQELELAIPLQWIKIYSKH